jgi:hypothetical protein
MSSTAERCIVSLCGDRDDTRIGHIYYNSPDCSQYIHDRAVEICTPYITPQPSIDVAYTTLIDSIADIRALCMLRNISTRREIDCRIYLHSRLYAVYCSMAIYGDCPKNKVIWFPRRENL